MFMCFLQLVAPEPPLIRGSVGAMVSIFTVFPAPALSGDHAEAFPA
jgi:hypothetical protein